MNHPITAWYLAQARLDDFYRELERPRAPRTPRRGLAERIGTWLPHRHARPTTERLAPTRAAAAGCANLPMGCAA